MSLWNVNQFLKIEINTKKTYENLEYKQMNHKKPKQAVAVR